MYDAEDNVSIRISELWDIGSGEDKIKILAIKIMILKNFFMLDLSKDGQRSLENEYNQVAQWLLTSLIWP